MFKGALVLDIDVAREEGIEIGKEAGIEIGKEVGIEIGKEVGKEAGIEIGKEAGIEIGKAAGMDLSVEIIGALKKGKSIEEIAEQYKTSIEKIKKIHSCMTQSA